MPATERTTTFNYYMRILALPVLVLLIIASGSARAASLLPAPEGAFSVVVIPDTQQYRGAATKAQPDSTDPVTNSVFEAHTRWIVNNIESQRIVFCESRGRYCR